MTALSPYPAYRESGVPFLGDVPADWTIQPAVTLAKVLTSTVDKHVVEDEIPVQLCNYTDVYYNDEISPNAAYMESTASREQIAAFTVTAGDVVFTKDSETADDIGISAYVPTSLPGVVYGYHLATYRPRDSRYGKFLKWFLDSRYAKASLQTRTLGVTRVGLSQNTVRYIRVPTPPPDTAMQIAGYLDRETAEIDAFIADQEELIALLNERRAATIAHAVTRGLDPSALMKESGVEWIGTVPEAWAIQPLWSLFVRTKDVGHPHEPMLSVFREHGVVRKQDFDNINKTAENRNIYQLVHPGWLVANRMKAWQGSVGVSTHRGIVSGHYLCFSPQHHESAEFLNYLFRSRVYAAGYSTLSRGVRIGQAEIDNDQYRLLPVLLPPRAEQKAIVGYLDQETAELDAAIADAREAIALSKERRAALISAAVTGKVDVRGAA